MGGKKRNAGPRPGGSGRPNRGDGMFYPFCDVFFYCKTNFIFIYIYIFDFMFFFLRNFFRLYYLLIVYFFIAYVMNSY